MEGVGPLYAKPLMAQTMFVKKKRAFDPKKFFATIGVGRRAVVFLRKRTIFAQGDPADTVFYIQEGKVRLTVVSKIGKEATLGILAAGDFFGEGSLAGQRLRMGSAIALTDCELLGIDKKAMMLARHREHTVSDLFVIYSSLSAGAEHPVRRGFGGSALQFQREEAGSNAALARTFWQGGRAGDCHPQAQSGDPRGNGRYNPVAS